MISRLCMYFGVVGIASAVAWGGALLLLAAFARSRRRTRAYLAAFALSLLGFILARINSHNIGEIEIDREPVGGASLPREPLVGGASLAREDLPKPVGGASLPRENAPDAGAPKEGPSPAYREAGKQKRDEGAKLKPSDLTAVGEEADVSVARRLPEADVIRADAYDRLNLFFARLVPWLALGLVCLDYLSRFNRTVGYLPPIPIAGRAVDALFAKSHAVHIQTADPAAVGRYLRDLVRKGETFICLGEGDPVPGDALPRWAFGKWACRPLRKIALTGEGFPTSEFVLDSAWFGRYCFTAASPELARGFVADFAKYLDSRTRPHAAARRTVNVVWHFPEPIPDDVLRTLAALCRETNFKLVVFSPAPPAAEAAPLFDERVSRPEGGR